MNIKITGRNLELTRSMRDYAEKKYKKLEKYFHQLIDAHIIMYIEKVDHVVEIVVNGDGVQFYAIEKAGDMYSSIDMLYGKIEKQIVKYKERHSSHKAPPLGQMETLDMTSSQGVQLTLNQVSNKPMDPVEAFLEMGIDKRDFILFKKDFAEIDGEMDYLNRNYAVIYRDENEHKFVEIPFVMIKENTFNQDDFVEYNLNIIDDSPANPKFELKKNSGSGIKCMTIDEAFNHFVDSKIDFMPFFNVDSSYFNILYRSGSDFEVMVPTF